MIKYVIKAYVKQKNGNFVFIGFLPYKFEVEPINICTQLNEMFPNWKHFIDIEE